jgi:hypothetical protein
MRQVPSSLSGFLGWKGLIFLFTLKFHDTSVTKSLTNGKVFIGWTVTGFSNGKSLIRDIHISIGMPLTSAEHDPHLPALQFQRRAKSCACSVWIWRTTSNTTIPLVTSVA